MRNYLTILFSALLLCFFTLGEAHAKRIPSFTLLGNLKDGQSDIRLKPQDLEGEWLKSYTVYDPHVKKELTFTGVHLNDFVKRYGKPDTAKLVALAADKYKITFEKKEWENENILVAIQKDGEYMDYKNQGPIRIIYPHYDKSMLTNLTNFYKWIWMIKTIEFLP